MAYQFRVVQALLLTAGVVVAGCGDEALPDISGDNDPSTQGDGDDSDEGDGDPGDGDSRGDGDSGDGDSGDGDSGDGDSGDGDWETRTRAMGTPVTAMAMPRRLPAEALVSREFRLDQDGPFKYDGKGLGSVKMWVPAVPAGCKVPVIHLANGTGASCATTAAPRSAWRPWFPCDLLREYSDRRRHSGHRGLRSGVQGIPGARRTRGSVLPGTRRAARPHSPSCSSPRPSGAPR